MSAGFKILHAAVAFVIAAVSGLGVGGGGLFAVYLALFSELSQLATQGFNLLFFLFSSGASVCVQLFRRKINGFVVLIMSGSGLVGTLLGTLLAGKLPEEYLRRAFGVLLVSSAILSFVKLKNKKHP